MNEVLYHEFDRSYFCEERFLTEVLENFCLLVDGYSIVVTPNLTSLPPSRFPKIVILTGDEAEALGQDSYREHGVKVVFRMFNREQTCDYFNVFPVPCGYNWRMHNTDPSLMDRFYPEKPMAERSHDLFFAGQIIESRRPVVDQASKLESECKVFLGTNPSFRTGLKIDDYYRRLGNTKIALVPDGTSPDTFRYTEALASGCVIVMTRKTNLWYYQDAPVVFLENWAELDAGLVARILSSDLEDWSRRSRVYYDSHLSGAAVASYMAKCLDQVEDQKYAKALVSEMHHQLLEARSRIGALESSRDYRVGRWILSLPRVLKKILKKLLKQ